MQRIVESTASIARHRGAHLREVATSGGPLHPVLLVHGYAGSPACWTMIKSWLQRSGFAHVETFRYDSVFHGVAPTAYRLAERTLSLARKTGQVHLVGHSLGGIVIRYAIQRANLEHMVNRAVTIVSPHEGAAVARLGVGSVRELQPGSSLLRELDADAASTPVRWVAYYSDKDRIVSGPSAMIRHPALDAENVLVHAGHVGVLVSPTVAASLTERLRRPGPEATHVLPATNEGGRLAS